MTWLIKIFERLKTDRDFLRAVLKRLMFASVIICFIPLLLSWVFSFIGLILGCEMSFGGNNPPCYFFGQDVQEIVMGFAMLGIVSLITLPIAAGIGLTWLITDYFLKRNSEHDFTKSKATEEKVDQKNNFYKAKVAVVLFIIYILITFILPELFF